MTRYKTARIRGGADDHVRLIARLRDLITAGALPRNRPAKMFVGPSLDAHACILCREKFTHGEIEYEFEMDSHAIYLHRRCFDLWRELDAESETAP